jgi:CBS domain-containing protein
MGTAHGLIRERLERGERVVTIGREATAFEAARKMNEHHIGALVVTKDGAGEVVGIFTERDLLKRVVAESRRPEETRVGEVMTEDVIVCTPDTPVDGIRQTMREKHIRHMPVVDERGRVIGMISIGDLNLAETKVLTETISYLEQYMTRL